MASRNATNSCQCLVLPESLWACNGKGEPSSDPVPMSEFIPTIGPQRCDLPFHVGEYSLNFIHPRQRYEFSGLDVSQTPHVDASCSRVGT